MWVRASGPLSDNTYQLITPTGSLLLVLGQKSALVDTGLALVSDYVLEQLETFLPEDASLDFIVLSDPQADRLGGLPAIQKKYPKVELVSSPSFAEEVAVDKDFLKQSYDFNQEAMEATGASMPVTEDEWAACFKISRILGDGDVLPLGEDVELKIISWPGLSRDSISILVSPDRVLAGGATIGNYRGRERVFPLVKSSLKDFNQAISKISSLDVQTLCLPHSGALSGELVLRFLQDLKTTSFDFAERVKLGLDDGRTVEEIYNELFLEWDEFGVCPDGPYRGSQKQTLRNMIELVASSDSLEVDDLEEDEGLGSSA